MQNDFQNGNSIKNLIPEELNQQQKEIWKMPKYLKTETHLRNSWTEEVKREICVLNRMKIKPHFKICRMMLQQYLGRCIKHYIIVISLVNQYLFNSVPLLLIISSLPM